MSGSRGSASSDDRVLRVYVAEHCGTCRESRRLARALAGRLEDITVEVVDIDRQEPADDIFAVPTFCYRGKIVALGNPREDELVARVLTLQHDAERSAGQRGGQETAPRPLSAEVLTETAQAAPRGEVPTQRYRAVTACCGAVGIFGTILCSLSMMAPALGLIIMQGSMRGMSSSGSRGQAPLPFWWETIDRLGPEILVVSVLLVTVAVTLRRRRAMVPAIVGGVLLCAGMYAQPSLEVMEAATVLGIVLLVLAYVAGLRPAPGLAMVRPNR